MFKFTMKPYDVLFFGSGKPFHAGDVASSVFPPHPTTFAGAICARIYAYKRIDVYKILKAVYGPFIERDRMLYFPKPSNIYAKRKKEKAEKLFIAKPDYGRYKLFDPQNTNIPAGIMPPIYRGDAEIEPFEGFISLRGMRDYLEGKTPERKEILTYDEIFENEWRVGIRINPGTYSVSGEEDALYRVGFLRLKEEIKFVFWAEFDFERELKEVFTDENKLLEFFNEHPKVLKLGGEMKNAMYEVERDDFVGMLKEKLELRGNLNIGENDSLQVVFLSYGVFDRSDYGNLIDGYETLSMSLNGYQTIGIRSKNYGIKTKRAFPPGTVLWLKSTKNENIEPISFLFQNGDGYKFRKPLGEQNFIGTNLVILKKFENEEVSHV